MPAAVSTTVTDLGESRVRVDAEVSPAELSRRLEDAARRLGGSLRIPGFRRGKVPAPVVVKQLGREAVLDEAVRTSISRWYVEAVDAAGIVPVGDPELDLGDLPEAGASLTFSFEIGVRPTATLGTYKGLEVGRREPEADDEAVQAQLEQLRERSSRLETKEGEAAKGDFVVMDYVGTLVGEDTPFEGGEGRDQMVELGAGRLIPGFEDQLEGAKAGDAVTVELSFPDEYGAEHLAGKAATFAVEVKEVRERLLPELDDEFAAENAGFDTLDELREDLAAKLREAEEQRIEAEFREAVLDAVVAGATLELPDRLVEARAQELLDRMLHQLSHQGITKEMYFQISGKAEEDVLGEAKPDAAQALSREAVLAAVVEAEGLEPAEGDVLDALQATAARENVKPEKLRARLEKDGRLDELKSDLAQRMAVDLLVEQAVPVSVEDARAKGLLWTPDAEEREAGGPAAGGRTLWTPAAAE